MAIYVGTSGWSYEHWRGVFYPPGLPAAERLAYYARHFRTVELNASHYHWPREARFAAWAAQVPAGFRFSVKAPRGLTHARQLGGAALWGPRLSAGLAALGPHLGVLLIQLPPSFARDDARLAALLEALPNWLPVAVELRHPSWHCEAVYTLLARYGAAYCVMSGAGLPCILRRTAPFAYVRLHGPDPQWLYRGSYTEEALRWWAACIGEWAAEGRDVFVYFNNDEAGYAVRNALRLRELLGA